MKIIDFFMNNKMVCKELQKKGGDQIYNCASQNKTAGIYNEIENRLRKKKIIRKEHQLPNTCDGINYLQYKNTKSEHFDLANNQRQHNPFSWHSHRFVAHGVPSNTQIHIPRLNDGMLIGSTGMHALN